MNKPQYTDTYIFKHIDNNGYSKVAKFDVAHMLLDAETLVEIFKRFLLADGVHPNVVEKVVFESKE